jgi:hypothetical protein
LPPQALAMANTARLTARNRAIEAFPAISLYVRFDYLTTGGVQKDKQLARLLGACDGLLHSPIAEFIGGRVVQ